jgi:predicted lipase
MPVCWPSLPTLARSSIILVLQAPRPEIYMYGFGSPRVGNIPFAEKFDDLVFNAWRISNMNDIVTK